ncbi:MAG TPA: Ni/Fe-hydrogenase, b-type cytochrome subunit [Gemmatimonadales bacterium]|nr:Ni/Fe-hydrogenase, b-type cytochrome subunit [Gemmatimonadales bacterium]
MSPHLEGITLGREVPAATGHFRWIYLWGWPIRAMHWLAALSIVLLVVTGLYIGKPYFVTSGDTASHYLMGWMRAVHFGAAAVLVGTAIVRVYWLFAGNKFERWKALFPIGPRDWLNLFRQVKYYLMIQPEKAPQYLGHNPLQQLSYTGLYAVALLQVVTGFALYGQADPAGFFFRAFGWLGPLFGGMPVVRFVHHVSTWVFCAFVPIHVYLATRADVLEHRGSVSSIVTGGRFVPAGQHFDDE